MTGGQFREVDFDLLADYVGGALDGTPEEVEVARLIDTDPSWTEAHAELLVGVDAVRRHLADLAAEPPRLPPEVAERLDAALAAATADTTTAAERAVPDADPDNASDPEVTAAGDTPASTGRAAGRRGVRRRPGSVPGPGTPTPGRGGGAPGQGAGAIRPGAPKTRRRSWVRRFAGPVAVATAVVGFAGFGVLRMLQPDGTNREAATTFGSAADSAGNAPMVASQTPPAVLGPPKRVLASGTDYTPATLPDRDAFDTTTAPAPRTAGTARSGPHTEAAPGEPTPLGAPELARLRDSAALAACLNQVAAAHARGPITVDLVDYASYQGRAAMVVLFTDPAGSRWVWVSGPDCGTSPAGADLRYQSRVG